MRIEVSTTWGRISIEFSDEMTSENRASVFEEMAKIERAHKRPFGFGDFKMMKTDGTPIPCHNHRTNGNTNTCITCGVNLSNKDAEIRHCRELLASAEAALSGPADEYEGCQEVIDAIRDYSDHVNNKGGE